MTYPSIVCCLSAVLVSITESEEEWWEGGGGLKAATSFRVEQVSKWNCIYYQSGIQWFTEKTSPHFTLRTDLCVVVVTGTNEMGESKSHSFAPQTGAFQKHSQSSNSNSTIRLTNRRFTPHRKGQPCYFGRVSKYFYFNI